MTQPMFSLGDKVTGWKDDRTGMVVGNVTAIGEYEGIHQYHIALDSGERRAGISYSTKTNYQTIRLIELNLQKF